MSPKLKFYSLLALLLFLPLQKTSAIQEDETKNILLIFSLNEGVVAYQILIENFKKVLGEEASVPFKLYIEYLHIEEFPDITLQEYLFKRINEKYNYNKIDLLVLGGPRLVPLIEKYASDYIKNLPTISMDIYNPFDKNIKYSLHSNTIEILDHIDVEKNYELAFSLFPDYSSIYIISGVSPTDRFFNKIAIDATRIYDEQKKIINLFNLSMEEVIEKVKLIPENSIVIIPTFFTDADNVGFNIPEVIRILNKYTSAPIFILFDTAFDDGAFGGYVSSQAAVGVEAGKAAIKILNGHNPNSIKVDPSIINKYIFDYRELKRWGLENSKLIPANSIILHKEYDFFDVNKWLLLGALLFIILQTLLIVNLIRLNRKQKLTTQKLIETENHYRELSQEDRILRMGELTASLSHELNQPLTAIRNSAQAGLRFMQSGKSNPEMMDEILNNIVEDDKRAADVLSSIRQLMRLEKKEKEKINLNLKIKQIVDIFKGESKKQHIILNLNLPDHPVYVLGDRTQIQQVLLNFISNAAHAMEGASNRNKKIEITEKVENESVTVSVRDYGPGIDELVRSKLFKPFVTTKENGTGIGLAISKTIIDEHDGKIWAENNPDGGATFSFQLNLYNDDKS